jgi:hypothetical protein
VAPKDEASFEYGMFFPYKLPPREFLLQIELYFLGANGQHRSTQFLNQVSAVGFFWRVFFSFVLV